MTKQELHFRKLTLQVQGYPCTHAEHCCVEERVENEQEHQETLFSNKLKFRT